MATIQTNRAAHQRINPQMRVGKPKKPVLSPSEQADIRKAIAALQRAVDATNKSDLLVNLTTGYRYVRNTINQHNR
jgi:hypothetical protein